MTTIDTNTNQNILEKNVKQNDAPDKLKLQEELKQWSVEKVDKKDGRPVEKIISDLVSANIPLVDLEMMLSQLPIDKRMQAEKMIIESQRSLIATMSQEKYKQYLQAQFPSGVPSNISEMALSLATDTSEMYKSALRKIETTDAVEGPSEIDKKAIKKARADATEAATGAQHKADILAKNIAKVPDEVAKLDKATRLT